MPNEDTRPAPSSATPTDALTDDSPCPACGEQGIWREEADVGVGIIYGPYGCPCGWSECAEYDARAVEPDAPDGWYATPQGVLVNSEREAEEFAEMQATVSARFGICSGDNPFDGGAGS